MVKAFAIGGFAALLCFVVVGAAGGLEAPGSGGQDSEVIKRLDEIKASLAVSQRIQFVDAHARLLKHPVADSCKAEIAFPSEKCQKAESEYLEAERRYSEWRRFNALMMSGGDLRTVDPEEVDAVGGRKIFAMDINALHEEMRSKERLIQNPDKSRPAKILVNLLKARERELSPVERK